MPPTMSPPLPSVGFDASPLVQFHSRGLARLAQGLLSALEARRDFRVVRLAPAAGEALRPWRQRRLPRLEREQGLAGIHSFVSAFPVRGRGIRVQTVHELPWRHGERENADWRHRLWATLGARRADRVLCASEHVAHDLRRGWSGAPSKLRVVPWGVDQAFASQPPAGSVDEVVLGRYRLGQDPLLVALGAVRAKKGLDRLLLGLAEHVRRKGQRVQLVVTGPDTPDLRRSLGLVSRLGLARYVSTPGEIDEADLPALLRLSSCVAVLSRSEGFAFPVLEAMACGSVPLVPRDSAQSELAGPAGVAVDADDPTAVAEGLALALAERDARRDALAQRASGYTWSRSAEGVAAVWRELL
jgi:alpha-1,3-rhamnosyl/mannosyltransferase